MRPATDWLLDGSLLVLRLLIGVLFAASGWQHVSKTEARARSIGMPPAFTWALGAVELLGAASVVFGIFAEFGALALAAIMCGAVVKKIFTWRTGFWGRQNDGWYYELLYLVCNLLIVATDGGRLIILGR
ncbi:MAG: DoxX family protein [Gemmatimonadales bacterium]